MATISEVNVGSAVSWSINKDPDPPSTIHGIVTSINSEEEILTVKVWAILEDGSHEETDRSVEVEVGKVRIIQDFRSEEKQLSVQEKSNCELRRCRIYLQKKLQKSTKSNASTTEALVRI